MSYDNDEKFVKAMRYIYANIDKSFTLSDIADHISISLSSLKRLFIEATNGSPGAFIRRLRMEYAFRSLQNRQDSILEIALKTGFDDHSAFTRCFKDTFGFKPKDAREKLNIASELECITLAEPDIVDLTDIKLQSITVQGPYFISAKEAWDKLKTVLAQDELNDDFSSVFIGMGLDNPHDGAVAEDKVRFVAGVPFLNRNLGIEHRTISGGKHARFKYIGKPVNLGLAYHYIFGKWETEAQFKIDHAKYAFNTYDSLPEPLKEYDIIIHIPLISS